MSEAEREAERSQGEASLTEEEIALMEEINNRIDFLVYGTSDVPEGTIVTEPYFSDAFVLVELAASGQQ